VTPKARASFVLVQPTQLLMTNPFRLGDLAEAKHDPLAAKFPRRLNRYTNLPRCLLWVKIPRQRHFSFMSKAVGKADVVG